MKETEWIDYFQVVNGRKPSEEEVSGAYQRGEIEGKVAEEVSPASAKSDAASSPITFAPQTKSPFLSSPTLWISNIIMIVLVVIGSSILSTYFIMLDEVTRESEDAIFAIVFLGLYLSFMGLLGILPALIVNTKLKWLFIPLCFLNVFTFPWPILVILAIYTNSHAKKEQKTQIYQAMLLSQAKASKPSNEPKPLSSIDQLTNQLQKLYDLKEAGVLTEAEYQAQKDKLLK